MIIVRLIGGLGNQLFQYATARRLSIQHNVPLKLDKSGFQNYKLHNYSLNHFNILEDFATTKEIANYQNTILPQRALSKLLPYRFQKWVVERHYHFDPAILKLASDVYLDGYWQSERYFKDVEQVLRHELTIKTFPDHENERIANEILADEYAVSIHVRRGDYASNAVTNQIHGLTPLQYYSASISQIVKLIGIPSFYVFSDDHNWVRQNFAIDYPATYIDHNKADRNYEDLRLMSLCKHHIIANSTFSWWGAWLGSHPTKLVFSPKQWFNDPSKDVSDLIPSNWHQV